MLAYWMCFWDIKCWCKILFFVCWTHFHLVFPSWFQGSVSAHWQRYSRHGLYENGCWGQLRNRGIAGLHHHRPVFWISLPGVHADGQNHLPRQVSWDPLCTEKISIIVLYKNLIVNSWCSAFSEYLTKYDSVSSGKSVESHKSKKLLVPGSEFPLHQENSNMCKKVFDSSW